MNNSVNLIISGNLTGFSRFFTSADANVIYDEAKFDFDYRNFVTFLDTDDRAYAISFEKNVIAVSLVVRSLDSFRRPGILVFSILMHRKQKALYKLMPQSKTVLFDLLDEIYEAFMSRNFVNGMLNQNGVVLKQDYYTEILNNYELVSDNEQKDINATLNMATRNKRAGYVVPENGDIAPYLETPCRKSYSGYHHVFISEKAPANINEGVEETERYDVVITNTKEMLREVSLKDKIPTLQPTNAYEEMFNQDYTFEDILSGKEPKISICPHGDGYAITYHFPKKTKTVQFVLKDGLDEIPWGKSLTLGYTIDGKIVNPIIASTYTFEGEELGRAIKLSITAGNYCIRKGFETLNLSKLNDKFTVQVEKTQAYSTNFEDSLTKSFIFRSANRDEVKVENVIEKLEVKLAGKLDEWKCTIEINGYEDYKCSLSDLSKKTELNFIPKQSSKNTSQQKQQKKEQKGGASLAAQQLNLADDKINKLLRKYAPAGIAAAIFVALVLVLVFVPGLWTSEGNKESVSVKTTDSVEVQATLVLVDADGDLIKRTDIDEGLDNKFNEKLRVIIDGKEQNPLNNTAPIEWEIKKKIPVNDSVGVNVVIKFDTVNIADTLLSLKSKMKEEIKVQVKMKLSKNIDELKETVAFSREDGVVNKKSNPNNGNVGTDGTQQKTSDDFLEDMKGVVEIKETSFKGLKKFQISVIEKYKKKFDKIKNNKSSRVILKQCKDYKQVDEYLSNRL